MITKIPRGAEMTIKTVYEGNPSFSPHTAAYHYSASFSLNNQSIYALCTYSTDPQKLVLSISHGDDSCYDCGGDFKADIRTPEEVRTWAKLLTHAADWAEGVVARIKAL